MHVVVVGVSNAGIPKTTVGKIELGMQCEPVQEFNVRSCPESAEFIPVSTEVTPIVLTVDIAPLLMHPAINFNLLNPGVLFVFVK